MFLGEIDYGIHERLAGQKLPVVVIGPRNGDPPLWLGSCIKKLTA